MKKGTRMQPEGKKSGLTGILVKLVLIAMIIYAGVTLHGLYQQIQSAEAQRTQLMSEVQTYENENAVLSMDIEHAEDPDKLEKVARDELGMVKNGEKVFFDTTY